MRMVRAEVLGMLVATVIAGCHGADPQGPPAPAPTAIPGPPAAPQPKGDPMKATLDWTLTARAHALHVDYRLTNASGATLWVVDDMVVWEHGVLTRAPDAIIVRNAAAPGVVSLFRGNLDIPTHDDRPNPSPGMRAVAPGASIEGSADVPLPLRAWHNYHPERMEPLRPGATKVELELQVLPAQGIEDKDWQYEPLADGTRLASPYERFLRERGVIVSGGTRALP